MKDSKMEDISDPNNPIKIFEHVNMKIANISWKYSNVFTSNRFKKARLGVFDTKKYKWSFNFTGPAVKLFVRVNFNLINYTLLPQEVKNNFTFRVSVYVSPHRKCQLIDQSDDIWRQNGRKTESEFICDSLSEKDFRQDIANPGDYMLMETQASHTIHHEFIALYFGKSYGTEEEPLCGEPEIMIGQYSRFNVQYKDYIIDCKADKYKSSAIDNIPGTWIHGLKCAADMKWKGSYPECVPENACSLERLLVGKHSNQTVVTSLEGLYFFNQSVYYAVEGTEVNYGCANPTDNLVGKGSRLCLKTGLWSGSEPYCYSNHLHILFLQALFLQIPNDFPTDPSRSPSLVNLERILWPIFRPKIP